VNPRWIAACAGAEAIGMAASAAAARTADGLSPGAGFGLVVAGGLVEGTALGLLQASVLAPTLGPARARAWALVTILLAGVGWAAGSAPATLNGPDGAGAADGQPPLVVILLIAAALGLALGALLGAAQAVVLRSRVRHPWRWVPGSALGWAAAMTVVFAGATTAGAGWGLPVLIGYGALTGLVAGTCLGVITGIWLAALDGPPVRHRIVLAFLVTRRAEASRGVTALAVTGTRTGRVFRFPVMCGPLGQSSLVVLPGHPERKSWWHQLETESRVELLDGGDWVAARARVVEHGTVEWSVARAAYVARWRRVSVTDEPLVVVDLVAGLRGDEGPPEAGRDAMGAAAVPS
jgi:F420H(2)-dependent quinone reductase